LIYEVVIAPTALRMLQGITDRRIRQKIRERIDGLEREPDKQGKPLIGELTGYRSLRAVGQRHRIIFRVEKQQVRVQVVAIGIRREGSRDDIYALAKRLLRLRLVDPEGRFETM